MKNIISNDEYLWLKLDIDYFISDDFTVKQKLSLLNRMETYYA